MALNLFACSSFLTVSDKDIENIEYSNLEIKDFCRGTGNLISSGNFNGRLNFTFTSSKNDLYIEFKDLLGRKTLFIIIKSNDIIAWDIRNNRKYDKASLLIVFPFFEIIQPFHLAQFLRGSVPSDFSDPESILDRSSLTNGEIQFTTNQTENGILINSVSFNLKDEKEKITISVNNREFDAQYPHLIKQIPQFIMPIKGNS